LFKNLPVPYFIKFLLCFGILYYGTKAIIGITAPGGFYWPFADRHLDYVAWLRSLLMDASRIILEMAGYDIYMKDTYTIRMQRGLGVHVVYSCLGYGVMSFWAAFVFANKGRFAQKFFWILTGLLVIFSVNVGRICIMLVATNNKWKSLFGLDNHTWFNIIAYALIFLLMWLFDRSNKKPGERIPAQ
jgi:exosortase/archaeosortase family protein